MRPRTIPPTGAPAELAGWGRTNRSTAILAKPRDEAALEALLAADHSGGLIARGAGRSYGDPAQNGGGTVVETTALDAIGTPDPASGEVRVRAGATLAAVLERLACEGLTLPVVPGTAHATVGGALAADVHGKNHPVAGSFGGQALSLELLTPTGERLLVSQAIEPEVFAATLGGMGLTGLIVAATLRTVPLPTPYAVADVDRRPSLEDALELIEESSHSHAIAWLDLLASGRSFARAVVTRSREGVGSVRGGERTSAGPERRGRHIRPGVPERFPSGLLRPGLVRTFNEALWLRAAKPVRERTVSIEQQLFPLDRIASWNNLYGPAGFVQYQLAVPAGREPTLRHVLELLRRARLPMYLATLKRFGAASGGLLSFPIPGWTLAVDIPASVPGLATALEQADALVAEAGGRLYLAKDSRMRAQTLAAMYPQLDRFNAVRARLDPLGVVRSDLARRVGLSL